MKRTWHANDYITIQLIEINSSKATEYNPFAKTQPPVIRPILLTPTNIQSRIPKLKNAPDLKLQPATPMSQLRQCEHPRLQPRSGCNNHACENLFQVQVRSQSALSSFYGYKSDNSTENLNNAL